jgi:hypothetical protein
MLTVENVVHKNFRSSLKQLGPPSVEFLLKSSRAARVVLLTGLVSL